MADAPWAARYAAPLSALMPLMLVSAPAAFGCKVCEAYQSGRTCLLDVCISGRHRTSCDRSRSSSNLPGVYWLRAKRAQSDKHRAASPRLNIVREVVG